MLFTCGQAPDTLRAADVWRRIRTFRVAAVVVVLTLWTGFAAAGQHVPLTIYEAEDLAVAGEPGQAALLAREAALKEQAAAATALPDPTLRVGLLNYPLSGGSFSTEGMTQAQFGIRQAFPRGRTRALSAARLNSLATELGDGAVARARDVLTAVRRTWLDVYYWQAAEQMVSDSRPFFADLLNVTRSMYSVGRKSQHDVLRAELELSRLDERLLQAASAREKAQAELSRWLGLDAYRPAAMKLPAWATLPDLEALLKRLDSHPQLAAATAATLATAAGVDLARESRKPDWSLDLAYGYREGYLATGESRSDFVSLNATVGLPFFGRNRQDRELAAALGDRRAAEASRQALRARLQSELQAEYARWTDITRRLALYEERILDQSQGGAEAALTAYQSDTGDFADVMRGFSDDLNTRLQHIRLQVELAQSHAVLANLGGLEQ
jgi:outer membrane protein TolC